MKFWKLVIGGPTILAILVLSGGVSCTKQAKHDHSAHDHLDHAAAPDESAVPAAQNYADAVKQLRARMTSLDAILKSGEYDKVHKDSVAIGKLGKSIGSLAAAPNSPVPKDQVKEVTAAGTELFAASRSFHGAAHEEDLPQVKEHYAQMGELVESLAQHVSGP